MPTPSPTDTEADPMPPEGTDPGAGRTAALLAPVVLALLVMAAHFLRFMVLPLVALTLLLPLLLLARRAWAVRVVQTWLLLGAVMWGATTRTLVLDRQARGQPYLRLSIILGAVSVLTLATALVLETPTLRRTLRRLKGKSNREVREG